MSTLNDGDDYRLNYYSNGNTGNKLFHAFSRSLFASEHRRWSLLSGDSNTIGNSS